MISTATKRLVKYYVKFYRYYQCAMISHCSALGLKKKTKILIKFTFKIVSEYDQEIPQSQTKDNSMALQGRATQPSQDTKKT